MKKHINLVSPICVILALTVLLVSCRRYAESTPRQIFEGDNAANYKRVYEKDAPADVTVVNSIVIGYAWRLGVVTTDDYEFELIVPNAWVEKTKNELIPDRLGDAERRKNNPIRAWYAPKDMTEYEAYRDRTSVGYFHMLVDKTPEPDGRWHVFVSKH